MISTSATRCEARLRNGGRGDTCFRAASVLRDGTNYCRWHDPVRRKERETARVAAFSGVACVHLWSEAHGSGNPFCLRCGKLNAAHLGA